MSETRILVSAVLLSAGVAAAVAAGTVRLAETGAPRIASVRLTELVSEHAAEAAREYAGTQETAAATRAWALALEAALDDVAGRGGLVLLPARAVAAGAPDLTEEVRLVLSRKLDGSAAASEPRR